jgi:uncharacterized membrane protein
MHLLKDHYEPKLKPFAFLAYIKIISILLTAFLLDPIIYFLLHILSLYDTNGTLKAFGFSDKVIFQLEMPSLILTAIYSAAFLLAIYFNIKKRYLINSMFLGTMITAYFIIAWFIKLP